MDPRWNRALAFLAEQHLSDVTVAQIVRYWTAYAADVAQMESLPTAERPIAAALVYQHLARILVHYADDWDRANRTLLT